MQYAAPKVTAEMFQDIPEGPPYFQVIDGQLFMSPSPCVPHQEITGTLYRLIANYLDQHPLGRVFIAPLDVYLDNINIFEPDVFFLLNEHKARLTPKGLEGAPDLVIEVLSPGTAKYDKGPKRLAYAQFGVQEFWLVDPAKRTVDVYDFRTSSDAEPLRYIEDQTLTPLILPGLIINLGSVFPKS